MTLKEAYEYGQVQLKNAEIDDAVLDAWYLLEHVIGISRSMYFMDMNREISLEQESSYRIYIDNRAKHIPLQHITGVQEFMGLEYDVNEHVLIPRRLKLYGDSDAEDQFALTVTMENNANIGR